MNIIRRVKSKFRKLSSRFGYGPGRRLAIGEVANSGLSLSKLHLGCGNIHIAGWCNVDSLPTGATDVVTDIRSLPGMSDESAEVIYACHVLEHFSHDEVVPILSRWREVLTANGELRISVPDLDAITRIYQKNLSHFQVPGHQPWIGLIYGGQKDAYDFHKTGFNFCWLAHLLDKVGFTQIGRYPHSPHFIPGVADNSLATEPFGEFISLNVRAVKG
jgi:predicted SAM-dependent methyltransferase